MFDNNTLTDTSARSHAPNNVQRKRTQRREGPPACFSGYQGEASFATSRVHKLDHKDSWTPHPLQASLIVRLRPPSRGPLRGALVSFPLPGGIDQSLISSHSPSLFSSPLLNQPGVDSSLVHTNRRRTLRSTNLRCLTSLSHLYSLATVTSSHDDSSSRVYVTRPSPSVSLDELTPLVRHIHWSKYRSHRLHHRMLACARK